MSQIVEAVAKLTLYFVPLADVLSSLLRCNRWHPHRQEALARKEWGQGG